MPAGAEELWKLGSAPCWGRGGLTLTYPRIHPPFVTRSGASSCGRKEQPLDVLEDLRAQVHEPCGWGVVGCLLKSGDHPLQPSPRALTPVPVSRCPDKFSTRLARLIEFLWPPWASYVSHQAGKGAYTTVSCDLWPWDRPGLRRGWWARDNSQHLSLQPSRFLQLSPTSPPPYRVHLQPTPSEAPGMGGEGRWDREAEPPSPAPPQADPL